MGDLSTEQGINLRPWMLNYEPELGMKGVIEPARVPESNTQQARFEKIHTLQHVCGNRQANTS